MDKWICECTGYCTDTIEVEAEDQEDAEVSATEEFPYFGCDPEEVDCKCEEVDE